MKEILSFFPIETIICFALLPLEMFFIIKSATQNRRQEFIYSLLSEAVLLIMLIITVKYLKDVI